MLENKISYSNIISRNLMMLCFVFFAVNIVFAQAQQFVYDSKNKRNPFIPLVSQDGRLLKLDRQEAKGDLNVEGIIYDKKGRSYAIVNGAVVGIGDAVAGYEILKIENNKVLFIKEGQITQKEIHKEGE